MKAPTHSCIKPAFAKVGTPKSTADCTFLRLTWESAYLYARAGGTRLSQASSPDLVGRLGHVKLLMTAGAAQVMPTLQPRALRSRGPSDFYSSYEVTVRLLGKERTYRAIALYHKAAQQDGRRRNEILDSITSNMNMVSIRFHKLDETWQRRVSEIQ